MTATTTAAEEQDWNSRQLAEPVAAPRFRVWRYAAPTIVLGCSQRALLASMAPRQPQGLLQRPSGGGAVLTGPWLVGVSVVLPPEHPWVGQSLVDSYRPLGLLHAAVLADMGVSARALPASEVAGANARMGPVVDWACYGSLAPWELVDEQGRKLVGLAQRRQRHGVLLVAGTLGTAPDWPLLCHAVGQPQDLSALRSRTVSCAELADRPFSNAALALRLQQALECALPGAAQQP